MFSVLNEISNNSHFRTTAVVVASNGTAAATYILLAITGYLSFGNEVGGNIVAQYAPSVSATVGRAAIVVLVMFSYPLQVHPCRASVDAVLKWRPKSFSNNSSPGALETSPARHTPLLPTGRRRSDDSPFGETKFAIITTVIIILSYITAMTVQSLESVLAYVGSTGSTSISFILPGLFYYKISGPDSALHQSLVKEEDDFDADSPTTTNKHNRTYNTAQDTPQPEDSHSHSQPPAHDSDSDEQVSLLSSSMTLLLRRNRTSATFRRRALRQLSLALAIYGAVVMVVCLITNIFFTVAE
jgi:amino acid permease